MVNRDQIESNIMNILNQHVGQHNAIKSAPLYIRATGDVLIPAKAHSQTRIIRSVVQDLRRDKRVPICSGAKGYWMAEDQDEFVDWLRKKMDNFGRSIGLDLKLNNTVLSEMGAQRNFQFTETGET